MEVFLNETESRYFGDLFLCCDVENAGKIPMAKALELYRSANLQNDAIFEITALADIPASALHVSRLQFYSCLKLIAAYQAGVQLRQEIISSSGPLPLPRFSWKESPSCIEPNTEASCSKSTNGSNAMPTPLVVDRKNSLSHRSCDWQLEDAGNNFGQNCIKDQQNFHNKCASAINVDRPTSNSEVEQIESSFGEAVGRVDSENSDRETHRHRGSPEAWSTNSDSPTPTNSVAERQWANETLWHGLLGDEHRQLLGTEEESSDRHSSEDENDSDLESVYQITPEQRDYYYKQFKTVQHDINGLLSGQIARVFFEKSRIPVEELRHIWQLCDVTRDGALSLAEFTAAMHLVVLRRNNIPLPGVLPSCLHPSVLQHTPQNTTATTLSHEPPEADLLHLNDEDEEDKTDNTVIVTNAITQLVNDKSIMNMSTLSSSSQASTGSRQGNQCSLTPPPLPPFTKNRSISNSPIAEPSTTPPNLAVGTALSKVKDRNLWGPVDLPPTQWTKFTESPTSNVSSPGPKPVNFDMQRTAQAVVSDPQILHPVPLRVTPVAGTVPPNVVPTTETISQDLCEMSNHQDVNSKQVSQILSSTVIVSSINSTGIANMITHNRESLQNNDLRAIQRPQAKKIPNKNIGALPPPPQRESSIGNSGSNSGNTSISYGTLAKSTGSGDTNEFNNSRQQQQLIQNKKDPPPLPPPRPHRHGRSSSLDLNKFKMSAPVAQQPEMTAQASFDLQTSTGFADFTNFSGDNVKHTSSDQRQYSLPAAQSSSPSPIVAVGALPTRISLQKSNQRVSAFEVYRKPNTPHNSQSPIAKDSALQKQLYIQPKLNYMTQPQPPMPTPFGALGAAAIAQPPHLVSALPNAELYEKRVNSICETLRHVSFKQDNNMGDILRHLREQNNLLLSLCNDLSDELLSVQTRKEELRLKMDLTETSALNNMQQQGQIGIRTCSSISAPVTTNVTGGSGSSGIQSNV